MAVNETIDRIRGVVKGSLALAGNEIKSGRRYSGCIQYVFADQDKRTNWIH